MRWILFSLMMLLPGLVQAQTNPITSPSVTTILDGVTMDVGTGWDVNNKTWVQTDTARFLEYKQNNNSGKYASFLNFVGNVDPRISVGYSTANKLVVGMGFNLFVPSQWGLTSPLLSAVGISPFAEYEFASLGNVESQGKNGWIFGAMVVKGNL